MTGLERRRPGFTLIEMIVVIAIIVVLAAILFPVLMSARNNARKVECLNHMHMIGQAMGLYVRDHNGYFPNWCNDPYANPNNVTQPPTNLRNKPDPSVTTWDMSLRDYLEKDSKQTWQEVMRCPANPLQQEVMGTGSTSELARAYALARQTQRPDAAGVNFYGGYAAMIPNPAGTVMIFEKGANLPGSWGDALGENVYQSHTSKGESGYTEAMFHTGGKNFLFVDGNVKWSVKGTGPFAWDPTGSNGPGACERWGKQPTGDWPPL